MFSCLKKNVNQTKDGGEDGATIKAMMSAFKSKNPKPFHYVWYCVFPSMNVVFEYEGGNGFSLLHA